MEELLGWSAYFGIINKQQEEQMKKVSSTQIESGE